MPGPATCSTGASDGAVARAAEARGPWAGRPVAERLAVVRRLRRAIARRPDALLQALAGRPNRTAADTLLAEILPLADACRFLEREAAGLLAPRRLGWRGRPFWLTGSHAEVRREPFGVVLVIGPDNYPLLLTAVPAVQALVAGNAVLIKPAPGGEPVAHAVADLLAEAGLPQGVCQVLGSDVAEVEASVDAGVDHVVLTGSASTGRAVLARLAERLVPATLELSGNDAVFVLPGADLDMVARAVTYGLRLNGSATCIAPRRVFALAGQAVELERLLRDRLPAMAPVEVPPGVAARVADLLAEARAGGGRLTPAEPAGPGGRLRPVLVAGASPDWRLLQEDVFAPVVALVRCASVDEALRLDGRCPYALGVSVFGPARDAADLAARLEAGSVTVNDLIVPTADPRLCFGGRRKSGYGVTRGAEGLLQMTTIKTVATRRGRSRPHYDPLPDDAEGLVRAWLTAAHGSGLASRLGASAALIRGLAALSRRSSAS